MKKGIKYKITTYYVTLIFVAFFLMVAATQSVTNTYLTRLVTADLIEEANIIASTLGNEFISDDEQNIDLLENLQKARRTLSRYNLESDINVVVKLPNKNMLLGKESQLSSEDLFTIVDNNDSLNEPFDYQSIEGESYIAIFTEIPFKRPINRISNTYLIISISKSSIDHFSVVLRKIQFFTALIVLLFASITGFILSNSMTKPLNKLNEQAKKIANKEFPEPLDIKTNDEIEELAHSVNAMSRSLKRSDEMQKRFFQNASHELKTPLMSIQGYAEGMIDEVFEKSDENLEVINQEVKRLSKLVNNISYLTKLDTIDDELQVEAIDISSIINGSIKKVSGLFNHSSIEIDVTQVTHQVIKGDQDKLIQAFINILSNGIRYANKSIKIESMKQNREVVIFITDDGLGIQNEPIDQIFERFYKGFDGQSGLGLSITKSIIEKHRGTIQVMNAPPKGAQFIIRLPIEND